MTNEFILETALKQSAIDSNCKPEDFKSLEPVVVTSNQNPLARRYLKLPFFLDLTSYGSNIVASCSPEIADFAKSFISRPDIEHCFETPALYELNAELAKYNHRVLHMAEYFLPEMNALNEASKKNICPLPIKILTQQDFADLYKPEWSNALCEARRELDVLGAAAFDGDKMVGFAACSADCDDMWQIGIDVLPEYRHGGIAKSLVTRLACEIIERGKVPFYCAAWSNVKSVRCAIASGFRPAWVTITAKPIE
ncbi:MAG: GNAT family N-acetyltransferase [Clostridiales bacterium]|nr:GNAT family N-acetyltransferase [Clostridiales bacterium]